MYSKPLLYYYYCYYCLNTIICHLTSRADNRCTDVSTVNIIVVLLHHHMYILDGCLFLYRAKLGETAGNIVQILTTASWQI